MNLTSPDKSSPQEEDFASLWESYTQNNEYVLPKRGDIRQGLILSAERDEIIVDIGAKQDALISPREVQRMSREERQSLTVGTTLNVFVLRFDGNEGALLVSIHMAAEYEYWQEAEKLMESGEIVQVVVSGYNKGGLLGQFRSLQGFIPASQVTLLRARRRGGDDQDDVLASFIGEELAVKVIEVNRRRRRLILSERAAAREWRAKQRDILMEELDQGQVRKGVVSNLCDFGAFVDLGGLDGLVHLSELSWGRVAHPSQVLRVGDEVEVFVLNVDRQRQRVGLSMRRIQPDPWSVVENKYIVGELITGRVTHLVKFGAFVELEPGIEGLVHLSELSEGNISGPESVVTEGDQLTLLVLGVDAEQHRISLSLRQAIEQQDEGDLGDDIPATGELTGAPPDEDEPSVVALDENEPEEDDIA